MTKENVIFDCRAILKNKTPINGDCGKICGKKCCNGDDKTGMIVFPGEKKLLEDKTNIKIEKGENNYSVALCGGKCERFYRPLACMMYPLFPLLIEKEGKTEIKVIVDVRSDCPLTTGEYKLTREFVRGVKRAGLLMTLNPETKDFLLKLSDEIGEYLLLSEKLKNNDNYYQ